MANWVTLTETDLLKYMSGEELTAFRSANSIPGQDDPVAGVITDGTNLVRSYVLQCPRYTLGPDGTVPKSLVMPACWIIVVDIMARAGGAVLDQSGQRGKNYDRAIEMLKDVARGYGPTVMTPDSTETASAENGNRPPGTVGIVYSADEEPQFTASNMEGI